MFSRENTARQPVAHSGDEVLAGIHRRLSAGLDQLMENQGKAVDLRTQACRAVLEEDLRSLLEECEEALIVGLGPESIDYLSLGLRCDTVLDEVSQLLD